MSKRSVPVLVLLTVASIAALLSGGAFLEAPLPGGLPIGNVVTVCVLCAPAGAAVLLAPAKTLVRRFSMASLIAACAWLPVSAALAGNLMLNFEGARGEVWSILTLATAAAAYASFTWAAIDLFVNRGRRGASTGAP